MAAAATTIVTLNGVIDDIGGPALAQSPLVKGDFNRDGQVNSADITSMFTALTDLKKYQVDRQLSSADLLVVADVNGDLAVNNRDIQKLLDIVAASGGGSGSSAAANENGSTAGDLTIAPDSNAISAFEPLTTSSALSLNSQLSTVSNDDEKQSVGRLPIKFSMLADAVSIPARINQNPVFKAVACVDAATAPKTIRLNAADDFYERLAIQHGPRSVIDRISAAHGWVNSNQDADVSDDLWSEIVESDALCD